MEIIETINNIGAAINYTASHPQRIGFFILVGCIVGIYLCVKGKSGKAAVILGIMTTVALTLLFP